MADIAWSFPRYFGRASQLTRQINSSSAENGREAKVAGESS
jgi:hypothetical protein